MLTVDVEKEEIKDSEVSKGTRAFRDPQVDMDKKGNRENKDLLATKDQQEKQVVKDPEVYKESRVCPE